MTVPIEFEVELLRALKAPGEIRLASLDARPWKRSELETFDRIVFLGRLAAVDLDSGRFHVRDDAGNRVPLNKVINAEDVAGLVGQRVRAFGTAVRDTGGTVIRIDDVTVAGAPSPRSGG